MDFPKHVFKAYDIRGLVEGEITGDLARGIGLGFATMRRRELSGGKPSIVVGRDMRETSPSLQEALMSGLSEGGADVIDIGLVSTPAFYFGVGHAGADGGIMVSASHNPAEYNGFKVTRENAIPVGAGTGMEELARLVEEKDFDAADGPGDRRALEGVPALAAKAELDFAGDHPIGRFKIVSDSGNGMGAQYLDELFGHIGADVTRMYWELDGTFPNHAPDPLEEENMADLQAKVRELKADIGIATDGDGDRIFFVDDEGEIVSPAVLRGLLAQIVLRDHPGATIGYDIRPGKITTDMIEEAGGKPLLTRVGHSLIKASMREADAPFGGESSGHFFYRFPTGTYEGPVTVAAQVMQEMTRQGKRLSEIVGPLSGRYVHSGEINFRVADKEGALAALKERFSDGEQSEFDGVSITYPDFWFNARASNTQPLLRLNLEAIDQATMEARRDEVRELINRFAKS